MGKIIKFLLYAVAAIVVLVLIVGTYFSLTFDANKYSEQIAEAVYEETGRELIIEGELEVSFFPWLAVEVGKTTLGNAEGFGDAPFLAFESATLGVQLMPLLLNDDIAVGEAAIDGLRLNLAVAANGSTNWQDFGAVEDGDDEPRSPADEARDRAIEDAARDQRGTFNVASIAITDAAFSYVNEQLNESYEFTDVSLVTGSIGGDAPVEIDGGLSFRSEPAGTSGSVTLEVAVSFEQEGATILLDGFSIGGSVEGLADVPANFSFDAPAVSLRTEDRVADFGSLEFSVFDLQVRTDVEPFSYAGSVTPSASIQIDAFSPRSLMQTLAIEGPETADPSALGKLMLDAKASVGENEISLSDLVLVVDDTTLRGDLVVPRDSDGTFRLNLAGDSIDLNRYMAPASDDAGAQPGSGEPPLEIPAELIRAINARGSLTLDSADLGGMEFENVEVGLNSSNGRLRIHPLTAEFFDGAYVGDININASGNTPVLSVNERIQDVSLTALGRAMFDRENITGMINGSFELSGRGNDMGEIQRTLNGNLSFTLRDGAWEGVDLWYQLRRARASFRQEQAPEPTTPARTPFSEVSATGTVTNGILENDDFFAELPFMQLNGNGSVNLPEATVDYSLSGRVFEQPEYLPDEVTPEELEDLTRAVIPLRISGPLASPSVGIDFEALLREELEERVEEEIKDRLLDLLRRD